MRNHLWACGYWRCGICKLWRDDYGPNYKKHCRECVRAIAKARYHTPKGKEYAQRYQREHPEANRRAQQKAYLKRKALKARENSATL
jgi:hypothetical protein